jgi:SpoVK/Ycf46/Vps4 family AAA+-type ATPase
MEDNFRFMNELVRIINGALRLDVEKVRNYTAFLAEKLENADEPTAAKRLRKLLQESDHQLRPVETTIAASLPVDSESRFPLVEKVDLQDSNEPDVVLSEEQWDTAKEFLSIAKSYAQIEAEGLSTNLSLLLCGPPGTGKSRLARHIARELGYDLYLARLDGLISSYVGSTSKNIRALFEFASRHPCVLFLDEFDAIAKLRGDGQEMGELKRVVNSFIQNLDTLGSQSIIVAATNHQELLDAAVWRRFGYRLELDYPTAEMRSQLWQHFARKLSFGDRELELLVDLSDGFSGSDINEVATRLHRRQLLGKVTATLREALGVMQNLSIGEGEHRRFLGLIRNQNEHDIANQLRERNPKLYSHSAIAQLLGVSKATAGRWSKGET